MAEVAFPVQQFYHLSNGTDNSVTLRSLRSANRYSARGATASPIVLRTIRQEDVSSTQKILADPENTKDDLSVANSKPEELTAMVTSWTVHTDPLTSFQFLVTVEDKPVGIAGLGWIGSGTALARNGKPAQIGAAGIVINPNARGHGYGFEALRIVIDYGLRELKLDQIELGTISRNTAMRKLMEDRFQIPATVTKPDRFGNDLEWSITPDIWATWLAQYSESSQS